MPDQVHCLVEVDPQFGIHRLVKNLKGLHRLQAGAHAKSGRRFGGVSQGRRVRPAALSRGKRPAKHRKSNRSTSSTMNHRKKNWLYINFLVPC
jgi:REP element-mobilizing transposase RayT